MDEKYGERLGSITPSLQVVNGLLEIVLFARVGASRVIAPATVRDGREPLIG